MATTKHILERSVYENTTPGRLAISILGNEPAHELFLLLMQITQVAMADKVSFEWDGEQVPMGNPTEPLIFEKPFYPRTMNIVKRLCNKKYLTLYGETERGIAYTLKVPPKEKRAAWLKDVTNEIEGTETQPELVFKKAQKPFTNEEQKKVMAVAGIPVGGTFDFDLQEGGFHFRLELTPTGLELKDTRPTRPDSQIVKGAMMVWQLQSFANKHNSGTFSSPMPLSEMMQVAEVAKTFGSSEFNTTPVDEVVARMDKEFRTFWAGFKKEDYVTQDTK